MQAFADALLVIPKILAQNSGYDPQETIVKLQVWNSVYFFFLERVIKSVRMLQNFMALTLLFTASDIFMFMASSQKLWMVAFSAVQNWKVHQDVEIYYLNKATDQKHFLYQWDWDLLTPRRNRKTNFFMQYQNIFQHRVNEKQENYQLVDIVWCNHKFLELKFERMSGRQWRDLWIEQVNVNSIWLAEIVNKVLEFYLALKLRDSVWSVSGGICWCWYPSGYWSLKWRGISSLR